MSLLKKLFIFVLFLLPLGEIIRINLGNNVVIKPLDIGVVMYVLLWVVFNFSKKQKIKQIKILFLVFLFATSGFLSLILNSNNLSIGEFLVSFSYLLRWVAYAGIFFVIYSFDKGFKSIIQNVLIIIGSLIVGLGYLQYFLYPSLKNLFYLGWDEHMYRMFSVFLDPNFAGAFFVLFFLFLATIFLKKKSNLIGLLLIFTLGAVFLTFSRSALIMLVVSSSLLLILLNKKIWIIVLLGIISLVFGVSSKYFNIENINLFRIISSEARLETAKNAVLIIKNNPLVGVGFNSYRYAQLRYGLRKSNAEIISHADAGTDNSLLFVMATTGVIGLIMYLFLWFRLLKVASILAIASIAGVFVDSMFINSLFYPTIMFWLYTLIGLKENT